MFYHLKGTGRREDCGDIILDKREIESVYARKIIKIDEDVFYNLIVTMKSEDTWKVCFNTEEELKDEMRNILGTDSGLVADYHLAIIDEEKQEEEEKAKKEKAIRKMLGA